MEFVAIILGGQKQRRPWRRYRSDPVSSQRAGSRQLQPECGLARSPVAGEQGYSLGRDQIAHNPFPVRNGLVSPLSGIEKQQAWDHTGHLALKCRRNDLLDNGVAELPQKSVTDREVEQQRILTARRAWRRSRAKHDCPLCRDARTPLRAYCIGADVLFASPPGSSIRNGSAILAGLFFAGHPSGNPEAGELRIVLA